ncbi:melanoma-associated antigen 8-like [Hippopotamus amphibius kiboko]|uniref:melanoma-associated antigen 8-like n=1 Tax=Hippopotamus amphibius kiboko TaxID=575201 RepID=UPI0025941405|nr:melanoma-associated antigen 8-like [Hippopotamus amphibius kiboko]
MSGQPCQEGIQEPHEAAVEIGDVRADIHFSNPRALQPETLGPALATSQLAPVPGLQPLSPETPGNSHNKEWSNTSPIIALYPPVSRYQPRDHRSPTASHVRSKPTRRALQLPPSTPSGTQSHSLHGLQLDCGSQPVIQPPGAQAGPSGSSYRGSKNPQGKAQSCITCPQVTEERRPRQCQGSRRTAPVRPETTPQEETCKPVVPSLSPARTPAGARTPVITRLVQSSELRESEADLQDPREAQAPGEAQFFGAEEEGSASPLSSSSSGSCSCSALFLGALEVTADAGDPSPPQSPQGVCPSPPAMASTPRSQSEDDASSSQDEGGPSTWRDQEDAEPLQRNPPRLKVAQLVGFLLRKYRTREPTTKAETLNMVLQDDQDLLHVVFGQASECMQLVFGVEVKEVDPSKHSYVLVPTLGLTCDGRLSDGQSYPKAALLVMLLGAIVLQGDCASEEEVWEALSHMGVYAGKQHCVCGEPRELFTQVWVREGYVEYRQVPYSHPSRYEFLWGPRAHAETSRRQVLEYLLRDNKRGPRFFPSLCAEAASDK